MASITMCDINSACHQPVENVMIKVTAAVFALLILGESIAWAACPPGTRYTCTQGWGGKVICSCS
jgi:hypothetical protein